ncbi:hypothetical protein HNY73_007097 [Argiope bruennichi]|uniref:Uncharacterized protein n=1 Tax=Argiope bruennichi TaxID=94029 RepID=A0A8T0FCW8_ARGBR|nr:hypothetical protein HNY73_007097 [Argiope bruennichi]
MPRLNASTGADRAEKSENKATANRTPGKAGREECRKRERTPRGRDGEEARLVIRAEREKRRGRRMRRRGRKGYKLTRDLRRPPLYVAGFTPSPPPQAELWRGDRAELRGKGSHLGCRACVPPWPPAPARRAAPPPQPPPLVSASSAAAPLPGSASPLIPRLRALKGLASHKGSGDR